MTPADEAVVEVVERGQRGDQAATRRMDGYVLNALADVEVAIGVIAVAELAAQRVGNARDEFGVWVAGVGERLLNARDPLRVGVCETDQSI
jgi:hypothetical protein